MSRRLSLCILLLVPCIATGQSISDKVDRFTGTRSVSYSSFESGAKPTDGVPLFFVSSRTKDGVEVIGISIFVPNSSGRPRYSACNTVDWLADGKPLSLGEANYLAEPPRNGKLLENLVIQAGRAEFLKLAAARNVEFRICEDEFTMNAQDQAGLRGLAHRINP